MSMDYPNGVSLILCTYNGAKLLPETIRYVNEVISDPEIPWEFIVIDNASDDGSGQVALGSWKRMEPLRVIVENEKGLIHARYRGIRESKYEIISFIDDDNWIDPHWITNVYRIFSVHPEVGVCGSRNTGAFEAEPPGWFEKIQGSYAIGTQSNETGDITRLKGYTWGAGMSFRKSAFEKLREAGFKSLLTGRKGKKLAAGEDTELGYAFQLAGWKIWYEESLHLQHYIPAARLNWNYVQKMYEGFGRSHAIFEIYKLVLKDKAYRPAQFYRRIFNEFWRLRKMTINNRIKRSAGNIDYLRYRSKRAKFITALRNISRNRIFFQAIRDLKSKVHQEPQF